MTKGLTSQEAVVSGIKRLYLSGEYSDLTIVCDDDVYKVHKAIVCPRIEFFHSAVKEAAMDKIDLSEDDPVVIKLLIQYLYDCDYDGVDEDNMLSLDWFECDFSARSNTDREKKSELALVLSKLSKESLEKMSSFFEHGDYADGNMLKFLSKAYKKAAKLESLDRKHHNKPWHADNLFNALLTHVKVYAIGHKYSIDDLKSTAIQKFHNATPEALLSLGFMDIIDDVYATTADLEDGLRNAAAGWIRYVINEIGTVPFIEDKLRQFPDLAIRVVRS